MGQGCSGETFSFSSQFPFEGNLEAHICCSTRSQHDIWLYDSRLHLQFYVRYRRDSDEIRSLGPCFGKSVRKEYRLLTDDERNRFHAAVWKLKENGDYLTFSRIHSQFKTSPGAHSGPAFFPWHREFIKRMEIAIRRVDPLVPGLPFWDSVLDHGLPNSQDSILWGNELMGRNDADGIVRNGAFAGWRIDDVCSTFLRWFSLIFFRILGSFWEIWEISLRLFLLVISEMSFHSQLSQISWLSQLLKR